MTVATSFPPTTSLLTTASVATYTSTIVPSTPLLELGSKPHQPIKTDFPKRLFGTKMRSFQTSWFQQWPWLHYSEVQDKVFCYYCVKATKQGLEICKSDPCFISNGFNNWKSATERNRGFRKHEESEMHKNSIDRLLIVPNSSGDVGELLSSTHTADKKRNMKTLLKILSSIRFLARQGISLQGNNYNSGNLQQLLLLRGEDDKDLSHWIEKKTEKYTSHETQNEILLLMSNAIIRKITADINSSPFFHLWPTRQPILAT
jgi:hypothetical protein